MIFLFIYLFTALFSSAQQVQSDYAGFQLQLTASIGTHRTSVGLRLNTYVGFSYAQLNIGTTYRFHAFNLGGRQHFGEWRHHTGLVLMAGEEKNPVNFQWDGALHQSKRPFSVGYTYLWYFDKVGTSQRSGAVNAGIGRVDVYFENDMFGGQGKDRFRTGQLMVSYRTATEKVTLGVQLWTGETRHSVWNKEPLPNAPGGYRDLSPLPYGKTSHGILFVSAQKVFMEGQVAEIRAGADSEQVRHIFQNKLSHDLVLFPKSFPRTTPHYPRLNQNGELIFLRKEKRRDLIYFHEGVNESLTY